MVRHTRSDRGGNRQTGRGLRAQGRRRPRKTAVDALDRAIGNNTVYEAPLAELDRLPDLNRFNPQVPDGFEVAQRSFHVGIAHGDQVFNLQLSITKELVELSVNVHTELAGKDAAMLRKPPGASLNTAGWPSP